MKLVMEEYEQHKESNSMPFDASRLIFGGFEVIIDVYISETAFDPLRKLGRYV